MWRNYVTVGIRALAKSRTYAFINILGLAIGMAACLMILLYVRYEISYDRWILPALLVIPLLTLLRRFLHLPRVRAAVDAVVVASAVLLLTSVVRMAIDSFEMLRRVFG